MPSRRLATPAPETKASNLRGLKHGPVNQVNAQGPVSKIDAKHDVVGPVGEIVLSRADLSLSDRTMETLAQIPPSPSPQRRRSSFFQTDTSMSSPSRPASPMSRQRPSTSHGRHPLFSSSALGSRPYSPVKRQLLPTTGNVSPSKTPRKFTRDTRQSIGRYSSQKVPSNAPAIPSKGPKPGQVGSKTFAGRVSTSRPSVQQLFEDHPKNSTSNDKKVFSKAIANTAIDEDARSGKVSSPKSSAALRETIAKAKAARSKQMKDHKRNEVGDVSFAASDWIEPGLIANDRELLHKRIQSARSDGRLNIAAMGLKEIPTEVSNMYKSEALGNAGDTWYESVDLVRVNAADNEIEELDDALFPDYSATAYLEDDSFEGSMVASLESLDLHGNKLRGLPAGFRRLGVLSSLNLSKNWLGGQSLEILSQMQSLRELRLADNPLQDQVDIRILGLKNLEVLDLKRCGLTALTEKISGLEKLRTLDISANRLEGLPIESLASLPLSNLNASNNRFHDILLPKTIRQLPHLEALDVSHNFLTALTEDDLAMPNLRFLYLAENRIEQLPDLSASVDLITVSAPGNKLSSVADGLVSLQKLKNLDLSRNDIRKLDERLGLLDGLTAFTISNNPLRERRLLSMGTEEIKRELRARLEPAESPPDEEEGLVDAGSRAMKKHGWIIHPGGVYERGQPKIDNITFDEIKDLNDTRSITKLVVRENMFLQIPDSLTIIAETLTSIDLSYNKLSGTTYLSNSKISLPKLKLLKLAHNSITDLQVLMQFLEAPSLSELDVSRNRLVELPVLRTFFPNLKSIMAADNKIAKLSEPSAKGLKVLDVRGNEIEHLEPRLGLLGAQGLRTLLVGANHFRVPRRDVVDKGTEAVLAWLRGRVPDAEI